MQFTLTMEQVQAHVQKDDNGKWDTLVPRPRLQLWQGLVTLPEEYYPLDPQTCIPDPTALQPTAWALGQMCQRLGIPTAYFRRCPPDLQDAQFNYWRQHADSDQRRRREREEPEQWLLRARHKVLRGVLSERYARMDNAPLLRCLQPLLESHFQVGWFALTEESLHLRLVDPRLSRDVLPNDRLMVGIHVANSEVGKRAVTVDAIVFRLVCENGLIRLVKGKSLLHQRHIYLSTLRFEEALRDAIGEALTIAAGFLEQLAWATRAPIRDIETTLKSLAAHWSLSQTFSEQVRIALLNERASQQETIYGLVNALTFAAQTLPVDDRYHLEVLAGRLLEQGLTGERLRLFPGSLDTDSRPEVLELCA